ncbi:hypothetical protein WA026_021105 [Henosepilachna vigintioctopunctata]|uniref:Uncharacterized protein n=1 Tax=Henosepilachna vigintioctopunctata TaxID=420089 RepID=A0AAW1UVX6_9CUCU
MYRNTALQRFGMSNCKAISIPLDQNYKPDLYNNTNDINIQNVCRRIIGGLIYAAQGTRPDLCESVR